MIVVEQDRESVTFGDLKPGDVFRDHGTVWVKAHSVGPNERMAVNPASGQWSAAWDDSELVQPLPHAKLVVTP